MSETKHPIPKELEGYDWEQVFGAAGEQPESEGDYTPTIYNPGVPYPAVPPTDPRKDEPQPPFGRRDVVKVIASVEGEHDEADWIAVVKLRDGRFAVASGGCDYTGWD